MVSVVIERLCKSWFSKMCPRMFPMTRQTTNLIPKMNTATAAIAMRHISKMDSSTCPFFDKFIEGNMDGGTMFCELLRLIVNIVGFEPEKLEGAVEVGSCSVLNTFGRESFAVETKDFDSWIDIHT